MHTRLVIIMFGKTYFYFPFHFYFNFSWLSLSWSINEDITVVIKKLKTNSLVKQVSGNFLSNLWNWTSWARRPALNAIYREIINFLGIKRSQDITESYRGNLAASYKQIRFQRGDFDDGILLSALRSPELPR